MNASEARIVLYVEDDPADAMFMQRAWKQSGGRTPLRVITDGQEAMDYLEGLGSYGDRSRHPIPNHLLLDLKLPRKTGIEVLQWLRAHPTLKGMPVIVFSSSREIPDLRKAKNLGIDDYVVKPMGFPSLLKAVQSIQSRWNISAEA